MRSAKRSRPTEVGVAEGRQVDAVEPQLLPCHIQHDGPAPVSAFFKVDKETEQLSAAFRGRALKGVAVALPGDCTGLVLQEDRPLSDSDDTDHDFDDEGWDDDLSFDGHSLLPPPPPAKKARSIAVAHSFERFVYWQRAVVPSEDCAPLQWMREWLPLSAALHSPVSLHRLSQIDLSSLALPQ